ncbi:MAG: PilZ domain-containing protein [Nitrospiraceae bacterium]|nr:MAG: PilZ domain-containing protein [Nitrospiraceae bacterium]
MTKNMEKRAYKRIPANIEIEYYLWKPLFWKKLYSGTIKNISEKGMLISTKTPSFPIDSLLEIYIPYNKDILFIPAKDSTIAWSYCVADNLCVAIGVELANPPWEYSEIIESIRNTTGS